MRNCSSQLKTIACAAILSCFLQPCPAASSLAWNKATGRVDAEIQGWKLPQVLESIAGATDWNIFVEPQTERVVYAKFKNQPTGEALRLLLGDINFALLPQGSGGKKLFVFKTALGNATTQVEGKIDTSIPIPNELLVRIKPGADINKIAKLLDATVAGKSKALHTYRLRFKDKAAADRARELLQSNDDVTAIGSNYYVDRSPSNSSAPPPPSAAGPKTPTPKAVGNSDHTIIGLIDTAPQLTGTDLDKFLLPTISVAGETAPTGSVPTHGTAMYQTMLRSIADTTGADGSTTRILPVDVYGANPTTTTYDVANGIFEAINNGATIINLSLGSEGDSGYLRAIIESGHSQGVTFIAAAGNTPTADPTFPAAYPQVLSVTSSDRAGNLASYANTGDWVDTIAPGTTTLVHDGRTWQTSGTSVAAAWLSGWVSSQASPRQAAQEAAKQFAR